MSRWQEHVPRWHHEFFRRFSVSEDFCTLSMLALSKLGIESDHELAHRLLPDFDWHRTALEDIA
jgi:hypothetical protein